MGQFLTKTVQNDDFCDDFRAAFPHLLRFGEKNRRSHFPPQNVVYMQKGIKIGPVVWPLTRSFPHFFPHFFLSSSTDSAVYI